MLFVQCMQKLYRMSLLNVWNCIVLHYMLPIKIASKIHIDVNIILIEFKVICKKRPRKKEQGKKQTKKEKGNKNNRKKNQEKKKKFTILY